MNFAVCVAIALRALTRNRQRSLLTVLGIIIGVAAVIVTVAIGTGARKSIEASIASLGTNLIVILPGSTSTGGVNVGLGSVSTLTVGDALAIVQHVRHVAAASPMATLRTQVVSQYGNWQTTVSGVSPAYAFLRSWSVQYGSFFDDTAVLVAAQECVLGRTVVKQLFPGRDNVVGETVTIRNVPFRIAGVMAARGHNAMGMDQDDVAIVPYTSLMERLSASANGSGVVSAIMVSIDSAANIPRTVETITALLRTRHRIVPPQTDDFNVRNLADIGAVATSAGQTLQILLASIATVSLVVGGIGIMNIMLVSVTERTREIGLRMAVGAPSEAILMQFLVEAGVLSTIGGLIGAALGVAGSYAAARLGHFAFNVSLPALAVALAFSAGIGIGFGFYPARKAASLDPIAALHAE